MAQQLQNTLSNFVTRVRRYLKEEDASLSQWSDNFLKQIFNTNYRLRSTELIMAHEGYFTNIGDRDINADQGRYAWPSGFTRLLKLEVVRSDGRRMPIERDERHYSAINFPNNSSQDTYMPTYRPVGSGFVLEPVPDFTAINGLRLEWNGVPEELTADGDGLHSDFPMSYDELLVLDTTITAFDQEGMQESGQVRTLLRLRQEWELRWERFIDGRIVSHNEVTPFIVHYADG